MTRHYNNHSGMAVKKQRMRLSTSSSLGFTLEEFGFIDDCALFPGVFDYACRIAGASMQV